MTYMPRRTYSAQRNPGSFESLINRTDNEQSITQCRKTPNKKVYKSFSLYEDGEGSEAPQRVLKYSII